MEQPIYQLLVEIDFADKTEGQRNAIMSKISNTITDIAEEESVEVITDKDFCWERTNAYDTVN